MSCNYILVVQGIRSMDDIELFTTWVGLSIICAYPAEDVRESISWPEVLVISFFNQLEQRALISPVATYRELIYIIKRLKFTQKL